MIEFGLRKHPSEISFAIETKGRLRRERGRYYLTLDSKTPAEASQFHKLFQGGLIEFNGHRPKELAAFDPGFDEPEARKLLDETRSLQQSLPQYAATASEAEAAATVIQVILNEGDDLQNIDALVAEVRSKREAAEVAKLKHETAQRRIGVLEKKLVQLIGARRKEAAAQLRTKLDAAAELFNKNVEASYQNFWSVARDLFPQIAQLVSFPNEVYSQSFVMPLNEAQALKLLRSRPAISVQADKLCFDTKPIKNA